MEVLNNNISHSVTFANKESSGEEDEDFEDNMTEEEAAHSILALQNMGNENISLGHADSLSSNISSVDANKSLDTFNPSEELILEQFQSQFKTLISSKECDNNISEEDLLALVRNNLINASKVAPPGNNVYLAMFTAIKPYMPKSSMKYNNETILEAFPRFKLCTEEEVGILKEIANWMILLFKVVSPKKNKGLAMTVITKLIEGKDANYVTGSGQTTATSNRVYVYEVVGNIKPIRRFKTKNAKNPDGSLKAQSTVPYPNLTALFGSDPMIIQNSMKELSTKKKKALIMEALDKQATLKQNILQPSEGLNKRKLDFEGQVQSYLLAKSLPPSNKTAPAATCINDKPLNTEEHLLLHYHQQEMTYQQQYRMLQEFYQHNQYRQQCIQLRLEYEQQQRDYMLYQQLLQQHYHINGCNNDTEDNWKICNDYQILSNNNPYDCNNNAVNIYPGNTDSMLPESATCLTKRMDDISCHHQSLMDSNGLNSYHENSLDSSHQGKYQDSRMQSTLDSSSNLLKRNVAILSGVK